MKYFKSAFTYVELILVVFIISLLGTLVVVNTLNSRSKSRDLQKIGEVIQVQNALEDYKNIEGSYPTELILGSSLIGTLSGVVFLDKIPDYIFYIFFNNNYYELEFELENKLDIFNSGFNLLTPVGHASDDINFYSSNYHLYFNGIDNYIRSDKNIDFNINSGDYSVSAWIYVDNAEIMNWQTVMGIGEQYTLGFHLYANRICTYGDLTAFCVSFDSFISRNNWHLISAVHDYNNKKITTYVDGIKVNEGTYGINLVNAINRPVTSGYRGTADYFKGYIYDARIYKRALSSDEMFSLYESKKISSKDLLVRWQMNEGSGCLVNDNFINVINGNLLVNCPENSPTWVMNTN